MSYQLTTNNTVIRLEDQVTIPFDIRNRDYRGYLEWLEEGNVPLEAAEDVPSNLDYLGFWDNLLISNVYQSIRSQALTTPAVLVACTEFIASFSDAKAGRANVPAIQACIDYLMQAGTFNQTEIDELNSLLVDNGLDQLFTIPQ
jgi:hypothetical protein